MARSKRPSSAVNRPEAPSHGIRRSARRSTPPAPGDSPSSPPPLARRSRSPPPSTHISPPSSSPGPAQRRRTRYGRLPRSPISPSPLLSASTETDSSSAGFVAPDSSLSSDGSYSFVDSDASSAQALDNSPVPASGSQPPPTIPGTFPTPFSSKFLFDRSIHTFGFVTKRSIACERLIDMPEFEKYGIVDLLRTTRLLGSVEYPVRYFRDLVCEFYGNLTSDVAVPTSPLYHRVFVRGAFREFSPRLISTCMNVPLVPSDRAVEIPSDIPLADVVRELSDDTVHDWPDGGLTQRSLGFKYYLLHRIMASNWLPCSHVSTLTPTQARLLYMIGTRYGFCLCKFIFDAIVGYADWHRNFGVVAYPCLISQILLAQDSSLVGETEAPILPPAPLGVNQRRARQARIGSTVSRPPPAGPRLTSPADGSLHSYIIGELAHLRALLLGIQSRVEFVEVLLRGARPSAAPPGTAASESDD